MTPFPINWMIYSYDDGVQYLSYYKILIILFIVYNFYNYYMRCRMPMLVYKPINDDGTKNDLVSKSGLDKLRFMPVFWYSSPLAQSFMFNRLQAAESFLDFEDEVIQLSDKGRLCLSWNYDPKRPKKGIVIVVTAVVGSTKRPYNENPAYEAIQNGFNVVVFNFRGGNG